MIEKSQRIGTTERPLVSIVIVCYNYGRFLGEAIESALQQTYSPTEVIVIDDGSTDDTVEVAKRYPVKFVTQKNQGVAAAVNNAMKLATGEYYVLVSADDKLHPAYVEKTAAVLKRRTDVTFVYPYSEMFGAKTGVMSYREFNAEALKKGNYIPGTALTRRSAFLVVGGYDARFKAQEDWDHWLSFAERGFTGCVLREPLLYYRQHTTNRNNAGREIIDQAFEEIRRKHIDFINRPKPGIAGVFNRMRRSFAGAMKTHTPGLYKAIIGMLAKVSGYHFKQQ